MSTQKGVPQIPEGVKVLGIKFQAFIDPKTNQAVFSQSGAARGLDIPRKSFLDILNSDEFKLLRGNDSPMAKLPTTVNSQPISVVTQADLVLLVRIAADKGYPVAKSMQDASFAILLQESVDHALKINRDRQEYREAGATLRQKLEYRYSYNTMRDTTLDRGYGVRGVCRINRQVSSLAVADADERRTVSKSWRKKCSGVETVKITIANTVHEKAVEASNKTTLDKNLNVASQRTSDIYNLLEAPF